MASNSPSVQSWRKRTKIKLVEIAGGKCNLCGYDKCISALEFHHLDPNTKEFNVTGSKTTRSFDAMLSEIRKCILVCANCHREVHAGYYSMIDVMDAVVFDEELAKQQLESVTRAKASSQFKTRVDLSDSAHVSTGTPFDVGERINCNYGDHRVKKVDWRKHDVTALLEQHRTYEAVGRLLGVTGAAIKRRVKYLQSKTL